MLPPGSFAAAAGVASREEREEASAQLCAELMRHLSALGEADGVSRIDWVMVRATGTADGARSHLGATRVGPVALKPFAPGAGEAAAEDRSPRAARRRLTAARIWAAARTAA
jgi:hypothetical protein